MHDNECCRAELLEGAEFVLEGRRQQLAQYFMGSVWMNSIFRRHHPVLYVFSADTIVGDSATTATNGGVDVPTLQMLTKI